jgi:hypothetical protein
VEGGRRENDFKGSRFEALGGRNFGFESRRNNILKDCVLETWGIFDLDWELVILELWLWDFGHGGPGNTQGFPRARDSTKLGRWRCCC